MKENESLFENKEKLAKNKLIILYIMKNVNCSLTNAQILRLLYDFEGFNYYYFQHLLSDLVEQNYIMNYEQDEEWLYQITEEGTTILDLTENMLPGIIIYKLDVIIKNILKNVKIEIAVTAEYIPEKDNAYITKCKFTESHKILFEVNVYCTSQEQAKIIADNWKNNAVELYPKFIELLTKTERKLISALFFDFIN